MSSAAPPQLARASENSSTLSFEETVILLNASRPRWVKIVAAVAFRCSSVMPDMAELSSSTTWLKSFALCVVGSYASTPRLFIAAAASAVGVYKSAIARFMAVAAVAPVTFCSASRRRASVVLSALCP